MLVTRNEFHRQESERWARAHHTPQLATLRWYACCKLREDGVSRVYMDVKMWNEPSIRGLAKTSFRYYGVGSLLHVLGKTITIWHEIPSSALRNRMERHQNDTMIEKTENKVVMCLKQK
jgi:hypothetical protein